LVPLLWSFLASVLKRLFRRYDILPTSLSPPPTRSSCLFISAGQIVIGSPVPPPLLECTSPASFLNLPAIILRFFSQLSNWLYFPPEYENLIKVHLAPLYQLGGNENFRGGIPLSVVFYSVYLGLSYLSFTSMCCCLRLSLPLC